MNVEGLNRVVLRLASSEHIQQIHAERGEADCNLSVRRRNICARSEKSFNKIYSYILKQNIKKLIKM